MKDYVVIQLVEVQVYATDEADAIRQAGASTTNWDDWNLADTPAGPEAREGRLSRA